MAELSLHEVRREPLGCQLGRVGVAEAVRMDANGQLVKVSRREPYAR